MHPVIWVQISAADGAGSCGMAVREAIPLGGYASTEGDDAVLSIIEAHEEDAGCPQAPGDGLCLIGVEY